jgi:hypothetical protein
MQERAVGKSADLIMMLIRLVVLVGAGVQDNMPPRYIVHKKDLQKGAKVEQKEHPWASPTRARKIARDHLQQHGPAAYRAEKIVDKVVQNVNKKLHAHPIKRRIPPRPFNPLTDDPFGNYRR